ncbi:ankyrin repeat domain-containing protein [Kineococcus indalonis]|uniref:ankyrin repeat domain-containing protein n=1 Tax=Kineococcus indalonis TaxID=2696566 RepID=UPI002B1BDCA1|nr:ankyrin repeat domain-containing protein [Kineococcus indalonis]NAZ84952.1 ankyrin repeat domain-containing protein [Kineococcus indalonis]
MTGLGEDGGRWAEPVGPADAGEERALELAHRVFEAARQGRTRELCAYLDAGVPVDSTDSRGDCLLMLAAYHGHESTVRALLERGSDPDAVDAHGKTPLAAAVVNGRRDLVAALVAADADPYLGSPSALESARFFGREDLLELLEVPGEELDGT